MPTGIIDYLVVCMILYMIVAVVLTGILPYKTLADPDAISAPIAFALNAIGYPGRRCTRLGRCDLRHDLGPSGDDFRPEPDSLCHVAGRSCPETVQYR